MHLWKRVHFLSMLAKELKTTNKSNIIMTQSKYISCFFYIRKKTIRLLERMSRCICDELSEIILHRKNQPKCQIFQIKSWSRRGKFQRIMEGIPTKHKEVNIKLAKKTQENKFSLVKIPQSLLVIKYWERGNNKSTISPDFFHLMSKFQILSQLLRLAQLISIFF